MRKMSILCSLVLTLSLSACGQSGQDSVPEPATEKTTESVAENQVEPSGESAEESGGETGDGTESMMIRITSESGIVIEYALNDSQAAEDLYGQLPLTIEVEDYSTNEKIFYPPEELDTEDAPEAEGGAGVLAYYEPWGDVVMFYDDFGTSSGLYALGEVTAGGENISELSGSIRIEQVETTQ